MMRFQAVYYRTNDGSEPVREFLNELGPRSRAALESQVQRLNLCSHKQPHLPFPWSSQVDGELRELRCHFGRNHYRVLYQRSEWMLVLLHVIEKRSKKLPLEAINTAKRRWTDFKQRMDETPRRPPRAAGRDAP